jgi:hypothetical protein
MDVQATAYLLIGSLHIERDDPFVNQLSRVRPNDLRVAPGSAEGFLPRIFR